MATTRKTTKSTKSKKSNKTEKNILEQFLAELDKEIDAKEAGVSRKMTKGQALVKSMINEALKGDQRMLGNVLKLIEKLDLIEEEEEKPEDEEKHSRGDWELMFAFFGKYEKLIKQEIERLKESNPSYWNFGDWFYPTLESAPWYEEIYGKKA